MKWLLIPVFAVGFFTGFLIAGRPANPAEEIASPYVAAGDLQFSQYTIPKLAERIPKSGPIDLGIPVATESAFTVYHFSFITEGLKVTGVVNMPRGEGPFPVVVQLRGYVDKERFVTGEGTLRSGREYAKNGFATVAPDFLGYGGSDMPVADIFGERFQTYTTALDLLDAVRKWPAVDPDRIYLWGHSNGGHIALTVLTATGLPYPVTLWAPVTKPFPYSVLYYTDDAPDGGRYLRRELARLETIQDAGALSFTGYLDRLSGPLILHQGSEDDAVPQRWNDDFVFKLKEMDKDIKYYVYPGADHNMNGAWDTVVTRDLEFFRSFHK